GPGPVELWDAKTGRFIARLEVPKQNQMSCRFFGKGQWVVAFEGHGDLSLHVFSAENGRSIAKLKHDEKLGYPVSAQGLQSNLSPSGRIAATVSNTDWSDSRGE